VQQCRKNGSALILTRFQPGDYVVPIGFLTVSTVFPEVTMETVETVMRAMISPEHPVETECE